MKIPPPFPLEFSVTFVFPKIIFFFGKACLSRLLSEVSWGQNWLA